MLSPVKFSLPISNFLSVPLIILLVRRIAACLAVWAIAILRVGFRMKGRNVLFDPALAASLDDHRLAFLACGFFFACMVFSILPFLRIFRPPEIAWNPPEAFMS
jgi:hypothetical protein